MTHPEEKNDEPTNVALELSALELGFLGGLLAHTIAERGNDPIAQRLFRRISTLSRTFYKAPVGTDVSWEEVVKHLDATSAGAIGTRLVNAVVSQVGEISVDELLSMPFIKFLGIRHVGHKIGLALMDWAMTNGRGDAPLVREWIERYGAPARLKC